MNTEPYGTTIFCDNIRHEVNGKMTLVGCYASKLNFSGPPPSNLPTFAALINLRIPANVTFKRVSLRVLKIEGDKETNILEIDIDTEKEASHLTASNDDEDDSKVVNMTFPCQWEPLPFSKAGFIKVRAYLDYDREIRLGVLGVNFVENYTQPLL
ncbi:MAG: hypothetical protein OSA51_13780 [Octadecabacter sp.]|nr:hypothetical protein [Octadecabacter sp.]